MGAYQERAKDLGTTALRGVAKALPSCQRKASQKRSAWLPNKSETLLQRAVLTVYLPAYSSSSEWFSTILGQKGGPRAPTGDLYGPDRNRNTLAASPAEL